MKKFPVFIIVAVFIFMISCVSYMLGEKTNPLRYEPAFSRSVWTGKQVCLFPPYISDKSNLSLQEMERLILSSLENARLDVVSPSEIRKMIMGKNLTDDYEKTVKNYRLFMETDNSGISGIAARLGFDYVLVFTAEKDRSMDDYEEYGYSATTTMTYCRTSDKTVLMHLAGTFESTRPKEKKNPNAADLLIDILSSEPRLNEAYRMSIFENTGSLYKRFTGECSKGDCLNGTGTLTLYRNGKLSREGYEGSWVNGMAHGRGTLTIWRPDIESYQQSQCIWENGVILKKESIVFLDN